MSTVTKPSQLGMISKSYTEALRGVNVPTDPLQTVISPEVNPVTSSLKVAVTIKGVRFVGSGSREESVTEGAVMSILIEFVEAI